MVAVEEMRLSRRGKTKRKLQQTGSKAGQQISVSEKLGHSAVERSSVEQKVDIGVLGFAVAFMRPARTEATAPAVATVTIVTVVRGPAAPYDGEVCRLELVRPLAAPLERTGQTVAHVVVGQANVGRQIQLKWSKRWRTLVGLG